MFKLINTQSRLRLKWVLLVLLSGVLMPILAIDSPIRILAPSGGLNIGSIYQGENATMVYHVQNVSNDMVTVDAVIAQGVGPQNIQFPRSLKPGEKAPISFVFNSSYLAGPINEHITIVTGNNQDYSLKITGEVKPRFHFNEPVLDFGFMNAKTAYKTTYVWAEKNLPFDLKAINTQDLVVKLTQTYVDPTQIDAVVEVSQSNTKAMFAYKIDVQVDPINIKRSMSRILAFQSSGFPQATPEIHLVGYQAKSN